MAFLTTSCMLLLATVGTLGTPTTADVATPTEADQTLDRFATIEATLAIVLQKKAEQDKLLESVLRKNAEQEEFVQSVLLKNSELETRVEALEGENERMRERMTALENSEKQHYESGIASGAGVQDSEKDAHGKLNGDGRGQNDDVMNDDGQKASTDSSLHSGAVKRQSSVLSVVPSGTSAVAFTASLTAVTADHLGQAQTIVYNHVITNVGNGYHVHTGVFIAPVSGVYVFTFDTMIEAGDREYLRLVRDGVPVITSYTMATGMTRYVSTSRTVVLQVNRGSEVLVSTSETSDHGDGTVHGKGFSSFSGWLLAVV